MGIFNSIWLFFEGLFNEAKKLWDSLPQQTQQSLENGSGIMNIINQYVDQDPALVVSTIKANYPNEDPDAIYKGLQTILKAWGITTIPATLEDAIGLVQGYLKGLESGVWPAIIHGAAQLLALVLSGGSTPFEIIASVLQWVYTEIVKPKEIVLASVPETPNTVADPNV